MKIVANTIAIAWEQESLERVAAFDKGQMPQGSLEAVFSKYKASATSLEQNKIASVIALRGQVRIENTWRELRQLDSASSHMP